MGAMLATSSSASSVGGPVETVGARPCVDGLAHVADEGDDERRELALPAPRRADVERVRSARRTSRDRGAAPFVDAMAPLVRYAARTPEAVDQIPDCSRESVAAMPASKSVAGASAPVVVARISRAGAAVVAVDPAQDLRHGQFFERSRVQQGREQGAGPLGPVVFACASATQTARADHGVGSHHR